MSTILTEDDTTMESGGTTREKFVRALRLAMEESETVESRDGAIARPYLVIDLAAVAGRLRGRGGGAAKITETGFEPTMGEASDQRDDSGGGTLRKLFLVGAVVGLVYALRRRSESVDEVVGGATDRAREMADMTEMRSGEVAGQAESMTEQAAERIEETGEMAADRVEEGTEEAAEQVREGGETAADRVQEGGEVAADEMEQAAEAAENAEEEATGEGEDQSSEEGEESEE